MGFALAIPFTHQGVLNFAQNNEDNILDES